MREVDKGMGWLIAYSSKQGLSSTERSLLQQRLHTHINYSQFGKYRYYRKGLLDEIPHIPLIRGVFIIRDEDYRRVCKVLKDYAVVHARRIILTKKDRQKLYLKD